MKKIIVTLLFIAHVGFSFGQYDYFKWEKYASNETNRNVALNSGITIDQYDRVFYIDKYSNKVCWQYGVVKSDAPVARSNSNLIQKHDNYGDYVFYIGQDNKIKCLQYLYSNGYWSYLEYQSGTVANGSFIEYGINNNQIFYVNAADNKVACYWANGSGWGYGPLNSSAIAAKSWSNLVFDDNKIFYVASNGKLAGLEYNFGTSTWDPVTIHSSTVATNSRIYAFNKDLIYYVQASDNKIACWWKNATGWGYGTVVENSTPAMTRTPLVSTNWNEVNYIGTDGNVHCIFWDDYKNDHYVLNTTCGISSSHGSYLTKSVNGALYFFDNPDFHYIKSMQKSNFVYIKGNKLFLNSKPYTPFLVNYCGMMYSEDDVSFFPGPDTHYDDNWQNGVGSDEATLVGLFEDHMEHIASLGFTAIRFNGFNVVANPDDVDDSQLYRSYCSLNSDPWVWNWPIILEEMDATMTNNLFDLYDQIFDICDQNGLKVNLFVGLSNGNVSRTACHSTYTNYLTQLATRFKDDERILCYSVILEPDMDNSIDCKTYSKSITEEWYDAIRDVDKNHLITMGIASGALNLLNWDPAIMKSDFLTVHMYPQDLTDNTFEGVRRNLQWTANTMQTLNKPWIIGETSFPGDAVAGDNAGTYAEQRDFGLFMRNNVFASGASALSWWQYHEVYWAGIEEFLGLIAHDGTLKDIIATGTNIFNNYTPVIGGSCTANPADYYNQNISSPVFTLSGTIRDASGAPIKDALVWGVEGWGLSSHTKTFTQSDGSFTLKTDHNVNIIKVSALGKEVKDFYAPFNSSDFANLQLNQLGCNNYPIPKAGKRMADNTAEEAFVEYCNIYPNPTQGKVIIEGSNISEIEIYNSLGVKVVSMMDVNKDVFEIDLSNDPAGVYLINCKYAGGKYHNFKIIRK